MAAAVVAAAFQHVEEAGEIGVHIRMRIDQRMAHPGLRRQMDDKRKAVLGEQRRGGGAVSEIELHEFEILRAGELLEPCFFELRVVIGREIVDADDFAANIHQPARDVEADEAGSAGDQNGIYRRHRSMPSGFCPRSSVKLTPKTMSWHQPVRANADREQTNPIPYRSTTLNPGKHLRGCARHGTALCNNLKTILHI